MGGPQDRRRGGPRCRRGCPRQAHIVPHGDAAAFRNFLLITIGVITSLVLSRLGVDIGPPLAGTGVVRLAVGVDAQALVKDIISGAFFL